MINVHNRIFTMSTNFTNCWIDKINWLIEHYIHLNNTSSIKYLSFTLCHVISSVALQLFHAVTWYQINKMKELAADVDITEVVFCSHTVGVTWKWEISIHARSVLDDNCEIHNCNMLKPMLRRVQAAGHQTILVFFMFCQRNLTFFSIYSERMAICTVRTQKDSRPWIWVPDLQTPDPRTVLSRSRSSNCNLTVKEVHIIHHHHK